MLSITMPKRRRLGEPDIHQVSTGRLPRGAESVIRAIDSQLDATSDTETVDCKVDLSNLIEAIPYSRLLQDMPPRTSKHSEISLVPRAYEERLMRGCISATEKACIMASGCECMVIDPTQPFIGVQYHIPGSKQEESTMCLLCILL